ncbi:MAG: tetratricopeptide repeat protein [Propionibacteriaceae bacterium]|nr:tetratricopeptide repeat protein [Propionibacteriaceae bacterium]
MPDDRAPLEPAFVGAGRQLLVEGLVAAFDQVNRSSRPLWIALEAPSGWGKTRVAREFYARLAADRQHEPGYWPPTILGSHTDLADDVSARRKRVHPHVRHVPGSLPAFLWLGVSASVRNGVPSFALAEDVSQLEAHAPYLDDAWSRLATWSQRHGDWWRRPLAEVGKETITEVAGQVIETVVGFGVPGLGLVASALGALNTARKSAGARKDRLDGSEAITAPGFDIVDETSALLVRLARPGLPVVVFVEDFHAADGLLAELLGRLVAAEAAILIVTTAWPGHVAEQAGLAAALEREPSRVLRIDHETHPMPEPFPADASLGPLPGEALGAIVAHYYPAAEPGTVAMLIERYRNPLAIELFCLLDRYRTRFPEGNLKLPQGEVDRLPETIRDLYRQLWRELPPQVRRGLTLASLGIPAAIDEHSALEPVWHNPLVLKAIAGLDLPQSEQVAASLASGPTTLAWARSLGDHLRQFHETDQWQIARDDDEFLWDTDRDSFLSRLAATLADAVAAETFETAPERAHAAWLAIALRARDLVSDGNLAAAVLAALDAIDDQPRELPTVVRLTEGALRHLHTSDRAELDIRGRHALALDELGQHARATELLAALHSDAAAALGSDDPETLRVRNLLANATRHAGYPGVAVQLYQDNLGDQTRVLGEHHPAVLTTLSNLANAYAELGRVEEAAGLLEQVHEELSRLNGADHGAILQVGNNLAHTYGRLGRTAEEVALLEEIVAAMTRLWGPADPTTLNSRLNLAVAHGEDGDPTTAIGLMTELLPELERVLGPDHPDAFRARNILGGMYRVEGRHEAAIAVHSDNLLRAVRTLGAAHPLVWTIRNDLAMAESESGAPVRAVPLHEQNLADRAGLLGPDHPSTLTTRHNLAMTYLNAGRTEEAIAGFTSLVPVLTRVLGAAHRDTLAAVETMAGELAGQARTEDLAGLRERQVADLTAALGPADPRTLEARHDLAHAYGLDDRREEAISEHTAALEVGLRELGPGHPWTLASRNILANALFIAARYAEATALYRLNLDAWQRAAGPDDPGTLLAMHNLGLAQETEGDLAEARDNYLAAATGRARAFGADDPDTLSSLLSGLVLLRPLGRPAEAVEAIEECLPGLAATFGETHETYLWALTELALAHRETGAHGRAAELEAEVARGGAAHSET